MVALQVVSSASENSKMMLIADHQPLTTLLEKEYYLMEGWCHGSLCQCRLWQHCFPILFVSWSFCVACGNIALITARVLEHGKIHSANAIISKRRITAVRKPYFFHAFVLPLFVCMAVMIIKGWVNMYHVSFVVVVWVFLKTLYVWSFF